MNDRREGEPLRQSNLAPLTPVSRPGSGLNLLSIRLLHVSDSRLELFYYYHGCELNPQTPPMIVLY